LDLIMICSSYLYSQTDYFLRKLQLISGVSSIFKGKDVDVLIW